MRDKHNDFGKEYKWTKAKKDEAVGMFADCPTQPWSLAPKVRDTSGGGKSIRFPSYAGLRFYSNGVFAGSVEIQWPFWHHFGPTPADELQQRKALVQWLTGKFGRVYGDITPKWQSGGSSCRVYPFGRPEFAIDDDVIERIVSAVVRRCFKPNLTLTDAKDAIDYYLLEECEVTVYLSTDDITNIFQQATRRIEQRTAQYRANNNRRVITVVSAPAVENEDRYIVAIVPATHIAEDKTETIYENQTSRQAYVIIRRHMMQGVDFLTGTDKSLFYHTIAIAVADTVIAEDN